MAKYYVRKHDAETVVSNLTVSDLKEMAQAGRLAPNDEIRKSGHATWHRASIVNGLVFCEPSTTATTPEGHPESIRHDEQIYNVESETIAEISEQISIHANEFEICWPDGRQDGPFSMSTIQQLTSDGFVNQACQFKAENEQDLRSFASLNLIDTQPEPCSAPAPHQPTVKTSKQKKIVKEKSASNKARREKTPRAKGWFRRFVVKSVSAIVIVAAVIALGSWGVWTAMSDSQKEMARNKYETIKKLFEDDSSESVAATGSGSVVNSSQTIANTNAGSNSMAPTGKMQVNANISVPEYGPLWVHEELRLPVIGSFYGGVNYSTGLTRGLTSSIQLFLVPPQNPIEGTALELRALYSAEQFGETKWFQVPKNVGDVQIYGAGGNDQGNPKIDYNSLALLQEATALGIYNQPNNQSELVKSWYNVDRRQDRYYPFASNVDDAASGNIDRIQLINIRGSSISFFQFARDANQRVVAVEAYDSKGNTLGEQFRFEYATDNTLSKFSTSNGGDTWVVWTPVYNNGVLTSLDGVGPSETNRYSNEREDINYRVTYEYDSRGRITNIVYTTTLNKTMGDGTPKSLRIDTNEKVLTASFVYKIDSHEHWSTAFVSGITTETKVRGLNPPEKAIKDFGTVRFEQALYTIQ